MPKKRFAKAYIEITNVCNLNCSFCKGTDRKKEFISPLDFELYARKLLPYTDYVYLHILGEPLLHPELSEILKICGDLGLKACITTNGTLLCQNQDVILNSDSLYKLCVSLHSSGANGILSREKMSEYLSSCVRMCKNASEKGIISVLRLWNLENGNATDSESILLNKSVKEQLCSLFSEDTWVKTGRGIRVSDRLFLEYGEKFSWRESMEKSHFYCYALKDQIGVLCDGTVVPCCIDCDGVMRLGNLKSDSVRDILISERAKKIIDGFKKSTAAEEYCKKCGFARARL